MEKRRKGDDGEVGGDEEQKRREKKRREEIGCPFSFRETPNQIFFFQFCNRFV